MKSSTVTMGRAWVLTPLYILLLGRLRLSTANSTIPAPIVVPPSQYWEGDDGLWSSFAVRVGNPAQEVRLMASTASPVTWVVMDDVCPGQPDTSPCAEARGMTFNLNSSTTWKDQGIFDLHIESNLNNTENGEYGLDTLGFGLTSDQGVSVDGQVIAGIETTNFDIGILGLNVQPTNFSNFNNPIPSLFQTLLNQNLIPSLSWSYTAGNQYSLKEVYGSLIFGGYDASRFTPNALTFPFAPDSSRDIVVGVQSISSTESSGKSTELLTSGILAFIDSTIPYIYMPLEVCRQFENAFGLVWDPTTELYIVSSSLHNSLIARELNFTFTLGNSADGGSTVQIVLPYAAFDLTAKSPLVNSTESYFPLKRGNDTQYALGRTFLQEAYLIADYQRGNFSISQCVFHDGVSADVQAIHPLGYVAPSNGTNGGTAGDGSSSASASSSSLSIGAIVGIVVAVVVLALVGIYLIFAYRKRRWPFHKVKPSGAAELDSEAVGYEADGHMLPGKYHMGDMPHEAEADSKYNDSKVELDSQRVETKNELPGGPIPGSRLTGSRTELHGSDAAMEMDGSGFYQELPADPVPIEFYRRSSNGASRRSSRTATRAASLRDEAVRRGSARSPLSPASGGTETLSPVSSGSPREGNRLRGSTARTMSGSTDVGTDTSHLMSPISAGSESREPSRSRGFETPRRISPMRLESGDLTTSGQYAVSRDPSRTRNEYHGP